MCNKQIMCEIQMDDTSLGYKDRKDKSREWISVTLVTRKIDYNINIGI
jgi:hypothetical protein